MKRTEQPGYLTLLASGELEQRVAQARERLTACDLCPRACGANRLAGEIGYCRAGERPKVASHNVHMWEEPPISGAGGSGTIFFSNCTARCLFCQNYPISQLGGGEEISDERLAEMMLSLQERGCHNINCVTPTHYVPQILAALLIAARRGLHIPLLYNTSGYDTVATLRLLENIVDIYLPDAKYADEEVAQRLSGFRAYVAHNRAALLEIHRQVGSKLVLGRDGMARRGMIIRHLILPHGLSQTAEVLRWIAESISREVHISLMAQYFPAHQAPGHPELGRRLTPEEYKEGLAAFEAAGLENGWQQELCQDY